LIKCSINELISFLEHQMIITISNSYLSLKKNWVIEKKSKKSENYQMFPKRTGLFWKHLIKNNDTKWLIISPENLKSDVENNMITNPIEAEATEDE
jgi:hypothetical protein